MGLQLQGAGALQATAHRMANGEWPQASCHATGRQLRREWGYEWGREPLICKVLPREPLFLPLEGEGKE